MSELINNSRNRIDELKKLILELHEGKDAAETSEKLKQVMGSVPYGEVVQAEEELIKDGLEREEILKFCDLHSEALKASLDTSNAKHVPEGHPVDIFKKENSELTKLIDQIKQVFAEALLRDKTSSADDLILKTRGLFNSLMDVEKHYLRKENLVFPYMEKYNITGPPMVMWGKHDETRSFLKSSFSLFDEAQNVDVQSFLDFVDLMFQPTLKSIEEMIYKEENILLPMCMDTFTEIDWYEILKQSEDFGYCLYYPEAKWKPAFAENETIASEPSDRIRFETGSFTREELEAVINTLPVDITFVDKDDKVRFFSNGKSRIFARPKAVLGRQVQFCHPPSSVHIVNQIVDDFKSGKQDAAKFWINMHGKFIHIAYYAVRSNNNEYLGTVEVSQELDEYRNISGERRILQYDN
ncbi:MAG: hemerythrin HHE cation binding domain protein [Ignavibacteria bacterium]|nr:MAG: hemerythrin HHE cation binding domain protein [Ignavibacteria bacterium]KAF0156677.1 MAG: hemerythrin HHE cation binding domain protein [Ignavibacteria bacterium]